MHLHVASHFLILKYILGEIWIHKVRLQQLQAAQEENKGVEGK